MEKEVNNKLIAIIQNRIPENIKPISFLSDFLDISKESVYRRLKGDIAFSLEEAVRLSQALNFSIDELSGNDSKAYFELWADAVSGTGATFQSMLQCNAQFIRLLAEAKVSETMYTRNFISSYSFLEYNTLFKFAYFKCIKYMDDVSYDFKFKDITISEEINSLKNDIRANLPYLQKITSIIDKHTFLRFTEEIQYFYRKELITESELDEIMYELRDFLRGYDYLLRNGTTPYGAQHQFFVSPFDIDANNSYSSYDGKEIVSLWAFAANPLIFTNSKICQYQKKWIESIKKHCILISESNESFRADFLRKQINHIENIKK